MLNCSLYVLNGFEDERSQTGFEEKLGQRIMKIYGPADLPHVIATEMQASTGRTLISGGSCFPCERGVTANRVIVSTNASFRDEIRDLGRHLVGDEVDIMELDFQPLEERRLWRASIV